MAKKSNSSKTPTSGKDLTRRSFLKTATIATGTLVVAGYFPVGAGAATAPVPAKAKAKAAASAASAIKRGGTLLAAQQNDWQGFDPHRQTSTANAFPEIYDCLVQLRVQPDGTIKPSPDLALSWVLKNDSAIFKLRQGVKFHDGSEWNANVAKYNIERLKDVKSTAKSFVESVKSVDVVDPFTLNLNLTGPSGSLLANLSPAADGRTFMISMAMAQKAGDKYGTSPETTAGTGPMKLVEWVSGSHHTVKRTGNYWANGADGKPLSYLDAMTVRFIADDTVRATELRSGNIHVINNVAAKDIEGIQSNPNVELVENVFQWSQYQFCFSTKSDKFKDNLKLRQAVHYAINREAVAKVLGRGFGAPQYYFMAPGYLGYDDKLPRYSHDIQKAKQLVAEAGYPNGVEISCSIINRPVDAQQAQILKQMLAEAGINLTLNNMERIAWTEKMASGNFEMATYYTSMRPDPDTILSGRFMTGDGKNYAVMSDKVMDDLLAKGRESYDSAVRAGAYAAVQKRIYETAWYGTIWYKRYYDGFSKKVKGLVPTQEPYWDLREAWLEG